MQKKYFVINPDGIVIFAGKTESEAIDFKKRFLFGEGYRVEELNWSALQKGL